MHSNEGDYKVWIDLKNGEREALEYIINKYYSDLYYYGIKLSKNPEISEDCIQDMLITLWEKRNALQIIYNLKSYLFKSLKRRVVRVLAAEKREEAHQENLKNILPEFLFSVEDKIIGKQQTQENKQKLISVLSKLSNRQKEIVYLKFYQGLNYDEIAEVMSLKKTIRSQFVAGGHQIVKKKLFLPGSPFVC
eukprot:TRINITY_DN11728_c0_g1_i1.p1 TRINITY_DN11728_c0_g1~~TRINITY_DN11728_c0_g1_i1.p1  ORF type:complete len:192 (-),score=11.47 TRINITY_DN11728_c0_g1_i1:4-579(-)